MCFIRIIGSYLFGVKQEKINQSYICHVINLLSIQLGAQVESALLEFTDTSFDILQKVNK